MRYQYSKIYVSFCNKKLKKVKNSSKRHQNNKITDSYKKVSDV